MTDFPDIDPATLPERQPAVRTFWNLEHEAVLRRMWNAGERVADIAAAIPGATRGSVISAAHRFGLGAHADNPRRVGKRTSMSKPVDYVALATPKLKKRYSVHNQMELAADIKMPIFDDTHDRAIAPEQRRALLQLTGTSCRWPVGDPRDADFYFCGADTGSITKPYCAGHARRGRQ